MKHAILVVDDEKDIVDSLERQFRRDYTVFKAFSGFEALKILQKEKVHLILSDQRMPEMTGVQMFEKAQIVQPDAIRILLTGYTDVDSVIAAINNGQIYRYITKPWDPVELDIVIKKAIESYDLRAEVKEKNKKLEAANRELRTLDEAKSHFMILIGHELKTPLTTMTSYLSLLSEELKNPDHVKYLLRVNQGLARLNDIVFDVLDLLAAETRQMTVRKKESSLRLVIENVEKIFINQLTKKNLRMKFNWGFEKAEIDEMLMAKVVKKIIHNAVKFSDEGSEIVVSLQEPGKVEISNHGPALSESQIEHILKPFNLDENILNHSQGMGLGLAVSQSLLRAHGSEIKIESSENQTTVSFDV